MLEWYLDEQEFGVQYKGVVVPFLSKLVYDTVTVVPIPAWLPRVMLSNDNCFSSSFWW